MVSQSQLDYLDDVAQDAWHGKYERVGVLSSGERRYVALASGRMRELCPGDSIPYAMSSLDAEWVAHMAEKWKNWGQPKS